MLVCIHCYLLGLSPEQKIHSFLLCKQVRWMASQFLVGTDLCEVLKRCWTQRWQLSLAAILVDRRSIPMLMWTM